MGAVKQKGAARAASGKRRVTHNVSIDPDVSARLKAIEERSGKTVSTIVEQALIDAFTMWDRTQAQRISLDRDLSHIRDMMEQLDRRVLLLIAGQNLDGALNYPDGPMNIKRAPATWNEWQGTLLRIRAEIERSETNQRELDK